MRKVILIMTLSLTLAALACGPATTTQEQPGPTTDAIPAPTATTAAAPTEPPVEASLPPAPTQDGSGAGGTPITNEGGDNTLEGFRQALLDNINSRNYQFLMLTMSDPFTVSAWRGGGGEMTPQEAFTKLHDTLLPPGNVVSYDLDKDITALLDGQSPQGFMGPDINIVDAVFEDGWGTDGNAEVIIFISQSPEGYFAWQGLVVATQGFK